MQIRTMARALGFAFVVCSGLYTAMLTQASSSDYRALFWSITPLALVHFAAVALYFIRVHRWHRWLVVAVGGFTAVALSEMALRVI